VLGVKGCLVLLAAAAAPPPLQAPPLSGLPFAPTQDGQSHLLSNMGTGENMFETPLRGLDDERPRLNRFGFSYPREDAHIPIRPNRLTSISSSSTTKS
jgi:hypothetical protein